MKLLMSRKIVPIPQTILLIIGVALGVLAILSVNSLLVNFKRGLELTLLGSVPNIKVSVKESESSILDKIIADLNANKKVDVINEVLTIQGKATVYSLKQGDGVFGNKRDTDFIMHGIKIYDIGHYTSLLTAGDLSQNVRVELSEKIREGLIIYADELAKINDDPKLHNKIYEDNSLDGRSYNLEDLKDMIAKGSYDNYDAEMLYRMERAILSSVGSNFAIEIENIISDRQDINSLAYSDRRVLINDGFAKSIFTMPTGKIRFEINALNDENWIKEPPEKIFLTTGGIFKQGFGGGGNATIFVSLDKMASVFGILPRANEIFVKLKNPYDAKTFTEMLKNRWGSKVDITNWISENKAIFSFIFLLRILIFLVLSMIVLVSAFGITAQLYMTVFEKERHIAVLKAIGATSGDVAQIFTMYSIFVGLCGTVLGILGAYIAAFYSTKLQGDWVSVLFNTEKIVIDISTWDIILTFLIVTILCFLAAIIPAKKASETNPIHGLNLN